MVIEAANWVWNRFRPQEGWLSLVLLFMVIAILNLAILDVGWVPG